MPIINRSLLVNSFLSARIRTASSWVFAAFNEARISHLTNALTKPHKMKKVILGFVLLSMSLMFARALYSHCEIPCGIYGDEMRFSMIEENITTVEKSIKLIVELSKEEDENYNQIVRWVNNKEKHADDIQHIVSQYFMTQRVKPVDQGNTEEYGKYVKKVTLLHQMLVYAMKTKQTTDLANVEKLRSLLADFRGAYFESEK